MVTLILQSPTLLSITVLLALTLRLTFTLTLMLIFVIHIRISFFKLIFLVLKKREQRDTCMMPTRQDTAEVAGRNREAKAKFRF
jgi:hypothetical protein